MYTRYFGREITRYTIIYGAYLRSTVLANPTYTGTHRFLIILHIKVNRPTDRFSVMPLLTRYCLPPNKQELHVLSLGPDPAMEQYTTHCSTSHTLHMDQCITHTHTHTLQRWSSTSHTVVHHTLHMGQYITHTAAMEQYTTHCSTSHTLHMGQYTTHTAAMEQYTTHCNTSHTARGPVHHTHCSTSHTAHGAVHHTHCTWASTFHTQQRWSSTPHTVVHHTLHMGQYITHTAAMEQYTTYTPVSIAIISPLHPAKPHHVSLSPIHICMSDPSSALCPDPAMEQP